MPRCFWHGVCCERQQVAAVVCDLPCRPLRRQLALGRVRRDRPLRVVQCSPGQVLVLLRAWALRWSRKGFAEEPSPLPRASRRSPHKRRVRPRSSLRVGRSPGSFGSPGHQPALSAAATLAFDRPRDLPSPAGILARTSDTTVPWRSRHSWRRTSTARAACASAACGASAMVSDPPGGVPPVPGQHLSA